MDEIKQNVITQTGTTDIKSFLVKGTFNDDMLASFLTFHNECISKGDKEAIIYIDSPGGAVHTFASMQAIIGSGDMTYHTVALGHACSAGCLLTAMGHFRWAIPETNFMFHDAAWMEWGKPREMKENIELTEKWIDRVFTLFADQTDKTKDFWLDKAYSNYSNDYYFTSEEALEYGMIDFIGLPKITKSSNCFIELPISPDDFEALQKKREKIDAEKEKAEQKAISKASKKKVVKKKTTKKKTKKD